MQDGGLSAGAFERFSVRVVETIPEMPDITTEPTSNRETPENREKIKTYIPDVTGAQLRRTWVIAIMELIVHTT